MSNTAELWLAIYRIGFGEGADAKREYVARLIELGIVEMGARGAPVD
jgi:hypothetical protein